MNPTAGAGVVELFAALDRELWVVTAAAGGRRGGLVVTSVNNASLVADRPRVVVNLARQHFTHGLVEASGAFALHLLGEEHLPWVWRFGLRSGRDADKFDGLETTTGPTGSPLLAGALARLDCRVLARMEAGDRTHYLAGVVAFDGSPHPRPLTFRRLRELAPADRLAELAAAWERDAAVDAEALRRWEESGV